MPAWKSFGVNAPTANLQESARCRQAAATTSKGKPRIAIRTVILDQVTVDKVEEPTRQYKTGWVWPACEDDDEQRRLLRKMITEIKKADAKEKPERQSNVELRGQWVRNYWGPIWVEGEGYDA